MQNAPFLDAKEEGSSWRRTDADPSLSPSWDRLSTTMGDSKRRATFWLAGGAAALIVLVLYLSHGGSSAAGGSRFGTSAGASAVHNSTFGFGAVVVMSLPERTDRRDGISLIASTTGVQVTKVIEATKGEDISAKARPYGYAVISDGYMGSWRTHMDALKYVVDNRIETALLLEDDVDWDVRIKSQLEAFSRGLASSPLRNTSSTPVSASHPYGTDWDIMHLGCVIIKQAPSPFENIHARYVDPDRAVDPGCSDIEEQNSKDPEFCWGPLLDTLGVPGDSRAILPSYFSIGLPAIAVTYEGAQRILFELSWKSLDNTLDWSVMSLLQQGRVRGWTVLPPLFGMFKVGNGVDSDLWGAPGEKKSKITGHSQGIERSAKRALNDTYFGAASRQPARWTSEYWQGYGITTGPPSPGAAAP